MQWPTHPIRCGGTWRTRCPRRRRRVGAGAPAAYESTAEGTKHVIFRDIHGYIYELLMNLGSWRCKNLTTEARPPTSAPQQVLLDNWRGEYNTYRPHQSLGYLAPGEFTPVEEGERGPSLTTCRPMRGARSCVQG
jgi:hypothetical protein